MCLKTRVISCLDSEGLVCHSMATSSPTVYEKSSECSSTASLRYFRASTVIVAQNVRWSIWRGSIAGRMRRSVARRAPRAGRCRRRFRRRASSRWPLCPVAGLRESGDHSRTLWIKEFYIKGECLESNKGLHPQKLQMEGSVSVEHETSGIGHP